MSFPLLLHVLLILLSFIFGCFVLGTTLLPWWLVSSMMCGSPSCYYGYFEMHNIVDATMATQVKLLTSFGLLNKFITCERQGVKPIYLNIYFNICGILLFNSITMLICWLLFWPWNVKSCVICYWWCEGVF
jgi:hypothetical protein